MHTASPSPLASLAPTENVLTARLAYSLGFAKRAITHLIHEGRQGPEDAPWYAQPDKLVAETGLLMVYAREGARYAEVSVALGELAESMEPLARSKAVLGNICLKPALALDYGCAHICLSYLGYRHAVFDDAIVGAQRHGLAVERLPYRMLEQAWLRRLHNGKSHEEDFALWAGMSCLHLVPDLFNESTDAVYALTHALMYVCFDREAVVPLPLDELTGYLESWLIIYIDREDYDIAGELLLAWTLTGRPFNDVALFAWHCLQHIEQRVGFLPAPNLDLNLLEGRELTERRTYLYSVNYHTAYVMGLLCGKMLEAYDDFRSEAGVPVNHASFIHLLKDGLNQGRPAHWMEFYKSLESRQQQALVPWLYQALLAREVRAYRYQAVAQLLEAAKGSNLEHLALSQQAQQLLKRLSLMEEG